MGDRAVVAAVTALLLAAGCSSGTGSGDGDGGETGRLPPMSSPPTGSEPAAPARGAARVTGTPAAGLQTPWGVAVLPDDDLLVASRDSGTIVRVAPDTGRKTPIGSVPGVAAAGEGGLLGLAVSPHFAADRLVYAYVTTESDNRIVRMRYDQARPAGEQLGAPGTVLRGIPHAMIHNGGRIAFGPDGMLYAGTGESGRPGLAQDLESLGGKILRMTPEGEPAPGNPFPGSLVYSYGHRNVQGLAWDAAGRLWATEFGQQIWDELNSIKPGGNYGWPAAEGRAGRTGYLDPVAQWRTDEASPSGIGIVKGSVWMAALGGERLWRIPLAGRSAAAEPQEFLVGKYGRLRTVVTLDDGSLLLTTSNTDGRGDPRSGDDRVLRLTVS